MPTEIPENVEDVPGHIRYLRIFHGLSREHVAARLGLSDHRYESFEEGRQDMPAGVFYRLCLLYGVTPDAIFEPPDRAALPPHAVTEETCMLIGEYRRIGCPELRQKVMRIILDIGIEQPGRKLFPIYGGRLGMGFPGAGSRDA